MVPGQPQRPRGALRRLLRVVRHRRALPGRPRHLRRHRAVQLDVGPGAPAVLLAPVLPPPARPQLRQPQGPRRDAGGDGLLARHGPRRVPARRGALPLRAPRHQRREPSRDARLPQEVPSLRRRELSRARAALRGQPVAGRRRGVLRSRADRGRPVDRHRVPHGLPLPRHAAHLHGGAPRVALPDLGDPRADPVDPRRLPVGHLPAQPRRAHPRDGDRRGPRLHVVGVRPRPADEGQHRHPPPARAAARQRRQPDGALHRAPAVAARLARPLLRRRDRDGRQHLARRPRRSAYADAVDARPQRGVLRRHARQAPPAGDPGPGLRLPVGQRRGAAGEHLLAAPLDPAPGPRPAPPPGLRARRLRRPRRLQPERAVLHPRAPRSRRTAT